MSSIDWLEIHLKNTSEQSGAIAINTLITGLSSVRDLSYIISSTQANPEVPLANLSAMRHQFSNTFNLTCSTLKPGSPTALLALSSISEEASIFDENPQHQTLIVLFVAFFDETMKLVKGVDISGFQERFPIHVNAQRVIHAIESLKPKGDYELELHRDANHESPIFSSSRDAVAIKRISSGLVVKPAVPEIKLEELTVIAKVNTIDFKEGSFTAESLIGLKVNSSELEDLSNGDEPLFEAPHLKIDGVFAVSEDGEVLDMVKGKKKRPIDTSSMEVENLQVDNEFLVADPKLEFSVEFSKEDGCYMLNGDFNIFLYAYSREELHSALIDLLQSMWVRFALADDSQLAPSGKKLKESLLARFTQR